MCMLWSPSANFYPAHNALGTEHWGLRVGLDVKFAEGRNNQRHTLHMRQGQLAKKNRTLAKVVNPTWLFSDINYW